MNPYANTAAYRFVKLADREALRPRIQELAQSRGLLGTVLLASEGINIFLAGLEADLRGFFDALG